MNTARIKAKALQEVGDNGRNAFWHVYLPLAGTAGTWTLSFVGQTTAPLARRASAAQVQAALEALPNVGSGNVAVMGLPGGPYRIELQGALSAIPLPASVYPLQGSGAALLPSPGAVTCEQRDEGRVPVLTGTATAALADYAHITDERRLLLLVKRDLLDVLLGESHKGVDVESQGEVERLSQQHKNLLLLREMVENELNPTGTGGANTSASSTSVATLRHIARRTPNGLPYGVLGADRSGRLR